MIQVIAELEKGCKEYNIRVTMILSLLSPWNGDNDQRSKDILRLMKKYSYNSINNPCGVVGIDIAGNEPIRHPPIGNYTNKSFQNSFKEAKNLGFGITIHAGEGLNCGWDKVNYAINKEYAMRIGHGYHLATDALKGNIKAKQLLIKLSQKKNNIDGINAGINGGINYNSIHFECCPTSSVLTNAVEMYDIKDLKNVNIKWDKHPICIFLKYNIPFSINTDDPEIFGCDMKQEINICKEKFGMNWKQIGQCFINAAKASFLKGKEKDELVELVQKRVKLWVRAKQFDADNNTKKLSKL